MTSRREMIIGSAAAILGTGAVLQATRVIAGPRPARERLDNAVAEALDALSEIYPDRPLIFREDPESACPFLLTVAG